LAAQTATALFQRLSRAGFKKDFVQKAILPDWWDESCANDPELLQDVEIRAARFLGFSIATLRDPSAPLAARPYPHAQLRRVRDVDRDRLAPAIHTAIRIASAVVRNLRASSPAADIPPASGLKWREQIAPSSKSPRLKEIANNLWNRGIPVVPLDLLPSPGFQGIACIVENRPVILLGYKYDEPGRAAFLIAHEAGHVAAGDCALDAPVVDEEDEITDDAEMERRADLYATQVLMRDTKVPQLSTVEIKDFKDLARRASELERVAGADASAVIFTWARQTGDYATATMAVRALYRSTGARKELRQLLDLHVNVGGAPETDRALLRCVHGDRNENEAAGGHRRIL
jgi:Zn-dependent peptidase ImmA (M78 family)